MNIVLGMISGIKSKVSLLAEESARMAKTALDAAKKTLDSHSPSRKFEQLVSMLTAVLLMVLGAIQISFLRKARRLVTMHYLP